MSAQKADQEPPLKKTPLHALHVELGAKMVSFAGYEMPVHYPMGVLGEHQHTRSQAGLFDVSHMGQAFLSGPDHQTVATALEALVPGNIKSLGLGRIRYTLLLTEEGGVIDDLMVTRSISADDDGRLLLVVNAARKAVDYDHLSSHLPETIELQPSDDRALLALQGPKAATVLDRHCPKATALSFMTATSAEFDGLDCHVSRSGYTGEDGFEISITADKAETLVRTLLSDDDVAPIGLGARDSLRLEAGLCLYGHDIDETTSPVEADLGWAISKARRENRGFPGAKRVIDELKTGPARLRVGIKPQGRAPAREGTEILSKDGQEIGVITSGGYGPTVEGPIAMGYVARSFANEGNEIQLLVRGKTMSANIVPLPFVPHRYYRQKKI